MAKLEKSALAIWPVGTDENETLAVLQGEYDIGGFEVENPIILDIGANIGAFAVWAKQRFPGSTIFCYEPHPTCYKALEKNVGDFATTRQTAVSDAEGTTILFEGNPDLGGNSLRHHPVFTKNAGGKVKVCHAMNLPECDVLKIDTEGSELDIIRNYPHLDKCKAVLLEWHSQRDREELREFLERDHGFQIVQDVSFCVRRGLLKAVKSVRPHLFIAILVGGGRMFYENEMCLSALRRVADSAGFDLTVSYDPGTGVDRARNRQVAAFLQSKATHLMMMDNDIGFRPEDITKMLGSNLEFVAGAYSRKQMEWGKIAAAVKAGVPEGELHEWSTSFIYNTVADCDGGSNAISMENIGDFVQVEEIGTGFMIMKRSVIERMIEAYRNEIQYVTDYEPRGDVHHMVFACGSDPACEYEQAKAALLKTVKELPELLATDELYDACSRYQKACKAGSEAVGRYLTEDYRMCRMWRMLGGKIWLYVECDLNHIGSFTFSGRVRHDLKRAE